MELAGLEEGTDQVDLTITFTAGKDDEKILEGVPVVRVIFE